MSGVGGLRHIYTAVEPGPGTKGGFQTVGVSKDLEGLVPTIETFVNGFTAPKGDEPVCRQLMKVPSIDAYSLTTFTATGSMPDRRTGNYHAETIIVPQRWLENAQWDTGAAFRALEWIGPNGTLRDDQPFGLPELAPGPLDRLAILKNRVPASWSSPLLKAVIDQSKGLSPLRIVAAPQTPPGDLEQLVMCLPLLVHPALRVYPDEGQLRCLTFRTMEPHQSRLPRVDLTGSPVANSESLEKKGHNVIDLGGRFPIPIEQDGGESAYISWLWKVIQEDRWNDLASEYEQDVSGTAAAWFASFRNLRSSLPKPPPMPATSRSAPQSEQQATQQNDRVLASVTDKLDAFTKSQADELEQHGRKVLQEIKTRHLELERDFDRRLGSLEIQATDLATLSKEAEARRQRLEHRLDRRLEALEKRFGSLAAQVETLQQSPKPTAPEVVAPTPIDTQDSPGPAQSFTATPESFAVRRNRTHSTTGSATIRRRSSKFWPGRLFVGAFLLFVTVLLVSRFAGSTPASEPSPDLRPVTEKDSVTKKNVVKRSRSERRQHLVEQFARPATARALLTILKEKPSVEPWRFVERGESLILAATLGRISIPPAAQIALLQNVLDARVDGGWGPSSQETLGDELRACLRCVPDNSRLILPRELLGWDGKAANCYLRVQLRLDQELCSEETVWLEQHTWTEAEAARVLALIRETTDSVRSPALKDQLATLDPTTSSTIKEAFNELGPLSSEQATSFLDLAYSWTAQQPDTRFPERPSDAQLATLEALVDSLQGQGANT